jgi:hypothetical protein
MSSTASIVRRRAVSVRSSFRISVGVMRVALRTKAGLSLTSPSLKDGTRGASVPFIIVAWRDAGMAGRWGASGAR